MFASKDTLLTRPSGYNIARSVRTRASASGYFNRTVASGNRQIWTFSSWIKRGTLSTEQYVFQSSDAATGSARLSFNADNTLAFREDSGASTTCTTSSVFRDPSAWYHIIVAYDTTQATSANRIKFYINGVQQTLTGSFPAQNTNGYINYSSFPHRIAAYTGNSLYFDGYLTEINFIDGQALTPSSFGTTNAITGVWQPAKYTGTYGTNGFYLNFSDNSNNTAATIGKDYSGNGNNWTPNNISVTAGVTYDSMTDVPTLTSATAANFAVWNPLQKTSTLSQANLLSAGGGSAIFYSVASTISIPSGKWYWEITCVSNTDGLTGIVETNQMIDVIRNGNYVGQTSLGYGYHANGKKYNNATSVAYGATYTTNDIIGVAFNADTGDLTFYKNGTSQGTAYTVSTAYTWLPADSVYASDSKAVNFGQRPFSYTPPTGFVALNTYNLPASTIKNGAAYMAATTYTGNGSTQSISNSVNSISFQPDFVWLKSRSNAYSHALFDSVRGATKQLSSDSTGAEATYANSMTAFNSNGFSVGSDAIGNGNTSTFVGWQWKAGGTSSSNTNGSITSTVSVGATQGFSVVTYTGTGANATVGHGLGVAPSMIILKSRVSATNWVVYHANLTSAAYVIQFNLTNAQSSSPTIFNSTAPTSSVFSIGTSSASNDTSMVAYCFAAVAGYSAFGSYTGNGSTDGPFVFLGFRPRFIMVKDTTNAGTDWVIFNTSSEPYNVVGTALYANSTNTESTNAATWCDILSNGFKNRRAGSANTSGATIIYAAFAENPFKYALAR